MANLSLRRDERVCLGDAVDVSVRLGALSRSSGRLDGVERRVSQRRRRGDGIVRSA